MSTYYCKLYVFFINVLCTASFAMETPQIEDEELKSVEPNYAELKKELDEFLGTVPFNGTISIQGQNGVQIYEKHIGYVALNDENNCLINSNSEFGIGSSSKHMLSTLALSLQESRILNINAPISEYTDVEELGMANFTSDQKAFVTLNTLLAMTSGLQASYDPNPQPFKFDAKNQGKHIYANESYTLVRLIIEKRTGQNIAELFSELFRTLGMGNTWLLSNTEYDQMRADHPNLVHGNIYLPKGSHFGYSAYCLCKSLFNNHKPSKVSYYETFARLKSGYSESNNPFSFGPKYIYPEGCLVATTAKDLHTWNHSLYSNKIINKESLACLLERRFDYPIPPELGKNGIYGLGMATIDGDVNVIGGWMYGFSSWLSYFKKEKISVAILENVARVDNLAPDQKNHISIFSIIKKHVTKQNGPIFLDQ